VHSSIKAGLVDWMKQAGAFDVRIADPSTGFSKVPEETKPLSIWPECRSVVVFAVAMSPDCNNIFLGPRSPGEAERNLGPVPDSIRSNEYAMDRLARLFMASVTLKGMHYLTHFGNAVSFKTPPLKPSALESGLGVYGRSGLILHPVLGNRMNLGAILTDAVLEPDPELKGFDPCTNCSLCIEHCPAKAFDPMMRYPEGWSYELCTRKRSEISCEGYYCHNCFAVCPAGKISDSDLFHIGTVVSISPEHGFSLQYKQDKTPGRK
jgi:epoxyqueuosine reductase